MPPMLRLWPLAFPSPARAASSLPASRSTPCSRMQRRLAPLGMRATTVMRAAPAAVPPVETAAMAELDQMEELARPATVELKSVPRAARERTVATEQLVPRGPWAARAARAARAATPPAKAIHA